MANSTSAANGKEKAPATKRAAPRATAAKRAPTKQRVVARPAASPLRKTSTSRTSSALPKWLTIGASVTGAVVAVGATLFATRKEWMPRAKQLGEWVEDSVHEQIENITAVRAKIASRRDKEASATATRFEPSGADAAFKAGTAAH
jgi:hypothetical protein